MRFDEYLRGNGIDAVPVEEFDGFAVQVVIPPDWELFSSAVGLRVWTSPPEEAVGGFCANAVLTMHRVGAALNPADVFTMLSHQQQQMIAGGREMHRDLAPTADGPGFAGTLELRITDDARVVDSTSLCRLINDGDQTLIAQLTLTEPHDAPAGGRPELVVRVAPGSRCH